LDILTFEDETIAFSLKLVMGLTLFVDIATLTYDTATSSKNIGIKHSMMLRHVPDERILHADAKT
jgi:hypothetical protein